MPDQPRQTESLFPNTDTNIRQPDQDPEFGWQRLIDAYRVPISRCLARRLPRSDQDTVDDFFYYLYTRGALDGYDKAKQRFRAYIQGVAKNFAREYRRGADAGAPLMGQEALDEIADADGSPVREVSDREWAQAVYEQAFSVLRSEKPIDAQLLASSYGLFGRSATSRPDLAERTGRTVNALNVAIHSAKRRLGDLIEVQLRSQCPDAETFEADKRMMLEWLRDAAPMSDQIHEKTSD